MTCAEIRLLGVAGVILASVMWCYIGYWLGKRGKKKDAPTDAWQGETVVVHDAAGEAYVYEVKRRSTP